MNSMIYKEMVVSVKYNPPTQKIKKYSYIQFFFQNKFKKIGGGVNFDLYKKIFIYYFFVFYIIYFLVLSGALIEIIKPHFTLKEKIIIHTIIGCLEMIF